MPPRATPLAPDARRQHLIDSTIPLLHEHGRSVTTRLIAEAAGVAEGTIFRVFASKDDLIDAVVAKVFEPGRMIEEIASIGDEESLRERALALVRLTQKNMTGAVLLLRKLDLDGPPEIPGDPGRARALQLMLQATVDLFRPFQADLIMPAAQVAQMLRLLTFSGTHPRLAGSEALTAEQIVDTVLYGAVRRPEEDYR